MTAALAAAALTLSYIEHLIPLPVPVPGIKLGFANIAVVVALYLIGGRGAFAVNLLRILLAGLMFSGVSAMMFALSGGIFSIFTMILLKRAGVFSILGVSVGGSAAHIVGQMLLAALIVRNAAMLLSLPILLLSAVAGGLIVGGVSHLVLGRL
jgi:heptaprenyl diphosphate synthase